MKKYYLILMGLAAFTLVVSTPVLAREEDDSDDDDSNKSSVTVTATGSSSASVKIREKIRAEVKEKVQTKLETKTRYEIEDKSREIKEEAKSAIREIKAESKNIVRNASTSDDKDDKEERTIIKRETKRVLELNRFREHQIRLVGQLELALNNLKQIRARIISRIDKAEDAGRVMTEAKEKLEAANGKITLAEQKIAELKAFVPVIVPTTTGTATTTNATTTATASTTVTVDLAKPRQVGESAIDAVHAARKALNEVVVAIAKSMGLKLGETKGGTSTTTTATSTNTNTNTNTNTSTTTTATSTATTTATTTGQ